MQVNITLLQTLAKLGGQSLQVPWAINSKSELSPQAVQWRKQPSARAVVSTDGISGQGGPYPNLTILRCVLNTT